MSLKELPSSNPHVQSVEQQARDIEPILKGAGWALSLGAIAAVIEAMDTMYGPACSPTETTGEVEPDLYRDLQRALSALSMAMGNPCLEIPDNGHLETALIDEATRRLRPEEPTPECTCVVEGQYDGCAVHADKASVEWCMHLTTFDDCPYGCKPEKATATPCTHSEMYSDWETETMTGTLCHTCGQNFDIVMKPENGGAEHG